MPRKTETKASRTLSAFPPLGSPCTTTTACRSTRKRSWFFAAATAEDTAAVDGCCCCVVKDDKGFDAASIAAACPEAETALSTLREMPKALPEDRVPGRWKPEEDIESFFSFPTRPSPPPPLLPRGGRESGRWGPVFVEMLLSSLSSHSSQFLSLQRNPFGGGTALFRVTEEAPRESVFTPLSCLRGVEPGGFLSRSQEEARLVGLERELSN